MYFVIFQIKPFLSPKGLNMSKTTHSLMFSKINLICWSEGSSAKPSNFMNKKITVFLKFPKLE